MTGRSRRRRDSKKKWCWKCDDRTTFLFDHGERMFICSECELE